MDPRREVISAYPLTNTAYISVRGTIHVRRESLEFSGSAAPVRSTHWEAPETVETLIDVNL
jgi:hypothetical protein